MIYLSTHVRCFHALSPWLDLCSTIGEIDYFTHEQHRVLDWERRYVIYALSVIVITARELTAEDHRRLNGSVERILQRGA